MNILVVGNPDSYAEFNLKFDLNHQVVFKSSSNLAEEDIKQAQVVFDFVITPKSTHGPLYSSNSDAVLFVNSVMTTLSVLLEKFNWPNSVIGFNGLPGMFNKPLLEITSLEADPWVQQTCDQLGSDFRLVEDRIGMVTPRVVCMIINEAFYTVEEGTATEADIDLAMKLGTNYPAGPFDMASTIGVQLVCQLLEALLLETGNIRYSVCPLLKKRSLEV